MFKIAFLQCQVVKELPHMNMPLFVEDIKALGCDFECVCAARHRLDDLIKYLKIKHFDLIAVDYIFPIPFLIELKKLFPKTKLVIGGSGFLDAFVKSAVDFAVIGAGRQSFVRLVDALKNKEDISAVPNLFFRIKRNSRTIIDYSGNNMDFDVQREIFPYKPFLSWKYIGFTRKDAIVDPPAIIADFGCAHRSRKLNFLYDKLSMGILSKKAFTSKARKRVKALFKERMRGGCSFCTCAGTHVSLPIRETVACLMEQALYLQKEYGFKSFVVGSENPFKFIEPLIHQMKKEGIAIEVLAIRSRADWVNKNRRILFRILGLAKKYDFVMRLQQLGIESFIQSDLDIYNKGYAVIENVKAIELMRVLKSIAPKNFQDGGHGFIGVNPWITLQELREYCKSSKHLQSLFRSFHFGHGLVLYDSCLPIYQKLRKDGLLIEHKTDLDHWRFKDKNVMCFIDDSHEGLANHPPTSTT